jgi:hypothetical protein
MNYPEHEKLKKVSDKSQTIGEFIDWLQNEANYVIGQYKTSKVDREILYPAHEGTQELLAKYFNIDLQKIEDEKRQMLKEIRNAKKVKT